MRSTMKCHHCRATAALPDDEKMILGRGHTDRQGRRHMYLYCRSCFMITDLVPTRNPLYLLRGRRMRCHKVVDPREIYRQNPSYFALIAPLTFLALQKDGVIPPPVRPEPRNY